MSLGRIRIAALGIVIIGGLLGYFIYSSQEADNRFAFSYGLDLQGGTQLVYDIDTSAVLPDAEKASLDALRDVIERRVNLFGVSEPVVQLETSRSTSATIHRLLVELPGVTDINEATRLIGDTPYLEFKAPRVESERNEILAAIEAVRVKQEETGELDLSNPLALEDPYFVSTELNGQYLESASVQFTQQQGLQQRPVVVLAFNTEGARLFSDLTREYLNQVIAIYLDGASISTPVVNDQITDGRAVISGDFSVAEARELAGRFNAGALPLPIALNSTSQIGATLGGEALAAGVIAGAIGLLLVGLYLLAWYRLPGLIAVLSLGLYLLVMLALFKLIPVTLTAAGIAGFVLSLGLAVDANVLIFERLKEELSRGQSVDVAITQGFTRAWRSIRDSNMSSILSAIILFWFGSSLIEGFALVFGLGTVVSMLTAITVTRTLLRATGVRNQHWYMPLVK